MKCTETKTTATSANSNYVSPKIAPIYVASVEKHTGQRGAVYRSIETKSLDSIQIPISLETNHPMDRLILKMNQLACYIRLRASGRSL